MSKPTKFRPDHRLATTIRMPGGVTVAEAIRRAEQRVEGVRETCVAALDEMIEALAATVDGISAPAAHAIYAHASEIYNLSATFGLTELANAAASLCDLLVNFREGEARNGQVRPIASAALAAAVRVHVDALRTLRRPDLSADAAARAEVVAGLRRVAEKFKDETGCTSPAMSP